ncbi:MAG: GGDEF domain-containing protein [Methylococcales bacterium]|jgi:diguanylate cyclase|nr:GGDEF domain-containing protein [Methylococcales bacterium]MBT7442915.1 GGDEF domain-containing protein [Methylococcales bacterium]
MAPNTEEYDRSIRLLKNALPLMGNLNIPTIPQNFAVWYEYASGDSALLNSEIDQMLIDNIPFTPAINQELYLKHIETQCTEALENTQQEIRQVINFLINKIKEMYHGVKKYTGVLDHCQESLSSTADTQILSDLVTNLIDETTAAKNSNEEMANSLNSMNRVVKSLKSDIKSLNNAAMVDALTNIANRRAFDTELASLTAKFATSNTLFSLLMIDIDHFKQFNDTFGHTVGDKVLKFVAKILTESVKGRDVVARYGGEEFAILLPKTNHENAMLVAQAICRTIEKKQFKQSKQAVKIGNITVSIGVSVVQTGCENCIIEHSDEALYKAKNNGRNQVAGYTG